jgi:serralysin
MPTLNDEVAFISGVDANGTLPLTSFAAWNDGTIPADYSGGYTLSAKFGASTAGTAGGTVYYYFDPASSWSATEQQAFVACLTLWSDVANISFAATSDPTQAQIKLVRGSDDKASTVTTYSSTAGAGLTGGSILLGIKSSTTTIDTSTDGFGPITSSLSLYGGYPYMTMLHELGHAIGLGHAGPYNSSVNEATQQFSAYDSRLWTIMSYINPTKATATYYSQYPVTDTNWGLTPADSTGARYSYEPTTWMPLDILAIQALYGVATDTPLSGGQTFGFNCNVTGASRIFFDFTVNTDPVITIWDAGTNNTLDLSGFSTASTVNLNAGSFSSCDGKVNNIAIAFDTAIDTLVCGSGNDTVTCNNDGDTVYGGVGSDTITGGTGIDTITGEAGNDQLNGGSNVDTAVETGLRAAYTITQTSTGVFTVAGAGGTDTLTNVEYLKFDDQTIRLLPGSGVTVIWTADPSTYMGAIRDFDGNNLGGTASWKLIGTADVNGDGQAEHILFNREIGRWAEVGTEGDGLTYFANYSWAGDTRVVGLYIDPLVTNGTVVKNSDTDSQRRFQNDLTIDNITSILGQADYDHNGLQEVYFSLTDGTAYLHAYMHADGNIQYANYQNKQQVIDYLTSNGWSSSAWSSWFPASQTAMEVVTSDTLTSSTTTASSWALATGTGS